MVDSSKLIRCKKCNRLSSRKTATKINGSWYGPSCRQDALNTAEEQALLGGDVDG